eukprot:2866645-Prymnesium_polylepis.1
MSQSRPASAARRDSRAPASKDANVLPSLPMGQASVHGSRRPSHDVSVPTAAAAPPAVATPLPAIEPVRDGPDGRSVADPERASKRAPQLNEAAGDEGAKATKKGQSARRQSADRGKAPTKSAEKHQAKSVQELLEVGKTPVGIALILLRDQMDPVISSNKVPGKEVCCP